jgi:hypothetical protein
VAFCEIGKQYNIELRNLSHAYFFTCFEPRGFTAIGIAEVPFSHRKKLGYRLGIYFGGQARAPHEIKIELEKS